MKRFARAISIIVLASMLAQFAEPFVARLSAPVSPRAAYAALRDEIDWDQARKDLRDHYQDELREQYSRPKKYEDLSILERAAVDQKVTDWIEEKIREQQKFYDDLEKEMDPDNHHYPRADDSYDEDFRNKADEGYGGSFLEDLFDGIDGRPFNLIGKIANLIAGFGIYDIITNPVEGLFGLIIDKIGGKVLDEIPGIGDIIKIILGVEVARIIRWLPFQLPNIQVGIPPQFTLFIPDNDPDFMMLLRTQIIELPVIIAAGLVMILACIPAVLIGKATESKTYIVECFALAGITIIDIAIAVTFAAICGVQIAWDTKRINDYSDDHKSLTGGAFKDNTLKLSSVRSTLGAEIPKEYTGIYINAYKSNANKWKQYVSSYINGANTERIDFADLERIINNMANDSLNKAKGYTQAIEARAETYAFAVQQTTNMRLDITRQIDVRARQALDRQQRRADSHAAFRNATKGGASWQAGAGY